jgi:2-isopropylmalate synthase
MQSQPGKPEPISATALGIGERVGNVPMDLLLVNMRLLGYIGYDLSSLKEYCRTVSEATRVPIPINYPVFGADAFRTGTGVHAAAVIKAMRKGDEELSNLVYSGVPAHWVGLEQQIEIGPMCGRSNVEYWLQKRGLAADENLVARIFERAKSSDHVLSEAEVLSMIAEPAAQD